MYLIGDAGDAEGGKTPPALSLLEKKLKRAERNASVVFLGDNLYPDGLAPEENAMEKQADEQKLKVQLDILRSFKGRIFFVSGNHDWYTYGIEGLERERKFIEKHLGRDDVWFPDPGCGDPKEIDLTDDLTLVLIDSQWWLSNWKGIPEINEGCEVKSREVFRTFFEDAIKGNRQKNIVIAMHHPLFSNGPHGGQFTAKEHIFPLTQLHENLWIPLPVIGSVYPFARATAGARQDVAHPDYRDLRDLMLSIVQKNGSYIFAAGHEHSLQYMERDDQYFIVSGGGSKRTAARLGNNAFFSYGGQGFSQLDFYEDGSVWVQYWAADAPGGEGEVVFRKQIKGPISYLLPQQDQDFSFYNSGADYIDLPLGESDFSRSRFGQWLWGKHYRDAYSTTVSIPVLDLASFQGGTQPVKRGGGYQTNSLRLETTDGRQYTMRSLKKDPSRMAAYPLNRSKIILDIIMDGFSGTHPLSATPLPAMQDAVNLYHTNPSLYYIPKQPALETYNEDFGDGLYLVEERPDDDVWKAQESFGNPDELISTPDVIKEIRENHDHLIDKDWIIRARLFDITIGDWDRHDDQWRWARFDQGGKTIYRPVPRDRDQAMSKYDGFMFSIARNTVPAARPLRDFKPVQKRIWWSNFGSRYFDNTFLTGSEWEDWERQARFIQDKLTDEIIETAFQEAWPDSLFRLNGPEIIETIKARRDNLLEMARDFYDYRARKVDVVGTESRDLFEVQRLNEDETSIRVYDTNKEGEKESLFYERTFHRRETKEILLYGLGDEDVFDISGETAKSIKLRLIGGLGNDRFIDRSRVGGWKKKTIIYDVESEENHLEVGKEAKINISDNPEYNIYNRHARSNDMDYWMFLPSFAFNPDDGFLLGGSSSFTHHGFMKTPYASSHFLSGKYALATSGFEILYHADFINLFGNDWGLFLDGSYRSPLYSINFYGLGNKTENPEDSLGLNYNRVRQRELYVAPALMKIGNSASRLFLAPTFESVKVERTEGRFIDDYAGREDDPLGEDFFEGQDFLGFKVVFSYSNQDDPSFPARGLHFFLDAGWKTQIKKDKSFPYLDGFVSFFLPVDNKQKLIFSTRLGGRHIFNSEFEFYQGASLGGTGNNANFRGFRRNRFTGRSSFYQNIDLRLKAFESENRLLPFSFGILAGFDHGRVWVEGENDASRQWHYSYGGGIFIEPLDQLAA